MWISEQEHLRQFLDGADWFVDNQDDNGGWPSQVRSKQTNNQNVINKSKKNRMNRLNKFFCQVTFNRGSKKYPGAGEVAPGWYGAMCQVPSLQENKSTNIKTT